jgi:fructose-1-phosphate kinase PfkB-like protein
MSFLTVCLNPTIQKTLRFPEVIPGEVNRTADHRLDASGKGINVSRVLTQLGKKVTHLTQLGGVMRELFLSLCEQDGLNVEWVESGSEIRFCYTVLTEESVTELVEEGGYVKNFSKKISHGSYNCRESGLSEGTEDTEIKRRVEENIVKKYDSLLDTGDFSCLVISGTKACGFSDEVIPSMVRKAKEKGLRVILDVKGTDLIGSLQYGPDVIKPNLSEFAKTLSHYNTQDMLITVALDINARHGCRVILTDGSRKIRAVDNNKLLEIDIKAVKPVNTTGCGDAFTAGLAAALTDGADFHTAVAEGIRCGALNAALVRPGVIR